MGNSGMSVVNRPAIPEPGRLEKTSGAILPYRPSRKLQKNSCLTAWRRGSSLLARPGRRRALSEESRKD